MPGDLVSTSLRLHMLTSGYPEFCNRLLTVWEVGRGLIQAKGLGTCGTEQHLGAPTLF